MKNIKLFIIPIFLFFSMAPGFAQEDANTVQNKSSRKERKEERKEARERNAKKLLSMVNDRDFVLEAYSLLGKYNSRVEVSPVTNFISVQGDQLTVQTAGGINQGYNGLGGITINGTITNYKVKTSKNNTISLIIQYTSPVLGHSSLSINIHPDASGRAMVTDNWGGRVTYQGNVVAPEKSVHYKGWSPI